MFVISLKITKFLQVSHAKKSTKKNEIIQQSKNRQQTLFSLSLKLVLLKYFNCINNIRTRK